MTQATAPVDAIAALTQASGGSPTQRAIEAALAGLALDSAAQQAAAPSVAAHQGALRAAQDGVHDASTSTAFSPAAQAQRATPLPAGSDVQATQAMAVPAASVDAATQAHNAAAPQAMPLQGVLAVPVALSALQTSSTASSARALGAGQHELLTRVQRHDGRAREQHGDEAFEEDDAAHADDTAPGDEVVIDDRVARWTGVLTAAGQDEALRDVRLSRQVLLVLPQRGDPLAPAPARAVLLGTRGVALLDAQWWPGAAAPAGDTSAWQRFRLFRDGDLLLRGGMRTRAGHHACRLLLGAGSAAGGWIDARAARLLLTERARVAQALLAQWTLLMLIAPQGLVGVQAAAHA